MNITKRIISGFLDCLFPVECLGCGKDGFLICNDCLMAIPMIDNFPCVVCGKPTIFGKTHKECLNKTAIDGAICATLYEEKLIKQAIRIYKYKFVSKLGPSLAWLMAKHIKQLQNQILPRSVLNEGLSAKHLIMIRMMPSFLHENIETLKHKNNKPILIPIPLHAKRLRERGFNQSEILAREFGKYFKWPTATNILLRKKYTTAQMTLSGHDRIKNIKNAFVVDTKNAKNTKLRKCEIDEVSGNAINNIQIKNRTVILIDDVLTTGATTNEAALTLKNAGAKEVWVFCLAKD